MTLFDFVSGVDDVTAGGGGGLAFVLLAHRLFFRSVPPSPFVT